MKKTILVCMAFACMVAVTSCGDKKTVNEDYDNIKKSMVLKKDVAKLGKAVKLENAGDSLSYTLGAANGYGLSQAVKMGMYPNLEGFNQKDFMEGFVAAFETDTAQQFYDFGFIQGVQLKNALNDFEKQYGLECDAATMIIALRQALEGDTTMVIRAENSEMVIQSLISNIQQKIAEENLKKGEAFLAEKEKEAGVVKTESGLLYKVVKAGEGPTVQADQKVNVSYKGTLIDGTEFDANENATFTPAGVVPGFGEGIQLMQKGGEYILYIPAELAYGSYPRGAIPANSVLVFEVKVLDIQ